MRVELSSSHRLTGPFVGFNTPVMWDIPFEDPKALPLFAGLRAGSFRFPGGSIANYWDWRTGRVALPETFIGSFRAGAADALRLHPQGSSFEDFADFAGAAGAEVNLVVNIETAAVADQVEWASRLVDAGVAPPRVELGNETYFSLFFGGSDRFASGEATLSICHEYIDALRAVLPPGTRFAIPSAGSRLDPGNPHDHSFRSHLANWDDAFGADDFYEATVVHSYPELVSILHPEFGIESAVGPTRTSLRGVKRSITELESEDEARRVLGLVLARVEEGTRRQVQFLDERTDGKEIWFTEWGVGENVAFYRGENPVVTAFWVHVIARQLQEFLRHPTITQALNHSLYFDGRIWSAMRRVAGEEQYRAIGAYDVFRWFGEALHPSTGEITVHDPKVTGARQIDASGDTGERYTDVTAAVIDGGAHLRTAIVHNVSSATVSVDLAGLADHGPEVSEMIHSADLRERLAFSTPAITPLEPALSVDLPSNCIARFVWRS